MSRTPMIVGNWKMNNSINESIRLVTELNELIADVDDVDVVVAPSFVALYSVSMALEDTTIKLCAQNCFWEENGAYTGEISPTMIADAGCEYVILGHSERRRLFHETDDDVNRKVLAALDAGLIPIICVGETLEERDQNRTLSIVESQVKWALRDFPINQPVNLVIAYEPVWAIGTGRNATPEQAQEVHQHIRKILARLFGNSKANEIPILYGGSVKPENIDALMAEADIDGALVGGASLDSMAFARIIKFEEA